MQAGNLAMIIRTSVGVPANTMALLIYKQQRTESNQTRVWLVQLMDGRTRRYLEGDLEVIK